MEIVKFIYNEISYFFKLSIDLSIQKIEFIFRQNNSGL